MANVLTTGADRGIGAALVRLYQSRGDVAIAACLKDGRDLSDEGIRVVERVDVTDSAPSCCWRPQSRRLPGRAR